MRAIDEMQAAIDKVQAGQVGPIGPAGPVGPAAQFRRPERVDEHAAVYVISVAAELAGLHPQTLRQYDRLGLVSPGRASGRGRRYSPADVARLREIARLSQDEGINLAGVKRILELSDEVAHLKEQLAVLAEELTRTRLAAERREAELRASYRRDLVPRPAHAIVVWQPLWGAPRRTEF